MEARLQVGVGAVPVAADCVRRCDHACCKMHDPAGSHGHAHRVAEEMRSGFDPRLVPVLDRTEMRSCPVHVMLDAVALRRLCAAISAHGTRADFGKS